ncbi:hypothetical protein [Nevskia sp.]|uniref:hypothetical protein n=1 Tax=Nevskia sp. TaxID=1929292 RepID=UPI0025EAC939|nr:hypothetical protein [Nevskia sp.]
MFRSRSHLHATALWLALAGVLLRSLVPVGFMPGWTDTAAKDGQAAWLIICPTSPLHAALAAPVAVDPHAHHHGGMDHGAMPAADPHANHDAGQHEGHRIAAAHLSCPFAGAGSPALPSVAYTTAFAASGSTAPDVARPSAVILAVQRRLPPARAPPAAIDTRYA